MVAAGEAGEGAAGEAGAVIIDDDKSRLMANWMPVSMGQLMDGEIDHTPLRGRGSLAVRVPRIHRCTLQSPPDLPGSSFEIT